MTLVRKACDKWFSDAIRESADWRCEFPGNERKGLPPCEFYLGDRRGRELQASHYLSRKYNSTRWAVDNAFSLCGQHHDLVEHNADVHRSMVIALIGLERHDYLVYERHRSIFRVRASDKTEIATHYREEVRRMQALRADGVAGKIELIDFVGNLEW